MKVTWLTIGDMTAEPWHRSLTALAEHETTLCFYEREPVAIDDADIVVYTGTAGGKAIPAPMLAALNARVPVVHFCADTSDPPWWPYLDAYRAAGAFRLTVNIDGNPDWPQTARDMTALTPIDPEFYEGARPHAERPVGIGICAGHPAGFRRDLIERLRGEVGLVVKPRNEAYGSYQAYADFMKSCRIMLNTGHTGSGAARQVKGRVIESGLAGCALLDHEESATRLWFQPYADYLPYTDIADAVFRATSLLRNPDIAERDAKRLAMQVRDKNDPALFWKKVFERAL